MLVAAIILLLVSGCTCSVEVSVEGAEGAFFLRSEDHAHRFALLGGPSPHPLLRARFGPFSAEEPLRSNASEAERITARLVTKEVRRDRPVLRVLFHRTPDASLKGGARGVSAPCVLLYVHRGDQHLMAACSPGEEGVCLAQATLPVSWWPPLHPKTGIPAPSKPQRTRVRVEYAVLPSGGPPTECADSSALPVSMTTGAGLPSGTPIDQEVALVGVGGAYEEVGADDVVRILVPQGPVYPGSKVYVPVHVRPDPVYPPYVFVIRARVKSGLRIVGAQVSPASGWSISVELNPRQTIATVTAFVKDAATPPPPDEKTPEPSSASPPGGQEVFAWLLEVEEGAAAGDGRVTWQLRYLLDARMAETADFDDDDPRLASRLDIRKDDVHALVPVAQWSQVLNTAVLTGRQVSQPMKVFVVSQAGKVGDVTLQSSCTAQDESILKVSPSCTSVYVDGSEVRGSQQAAVLVRYGQHSGRALFVVWLPEMPLALRLSDPRLSQVKGWRTPHPHRGKPLAFQAPRRPGSRMDRWLDSEPPEDTVCRLRFQQSEVEVFARFVGASHDSGREAFLLSRRAELRVTPLVAPFLRVADPRVAALVRKTLLQGMQAGRTEVQVLSPITGRVMGAREVRVGGDKETITQLEVGVVTGLQVAAQRDPALPGGVFQANTRLLHKLTSQYQEGVLDIRIHFSDGTSTPLSSVSDSDYHLSVDTFDGGVVAFAPVAGSPRPRVVAVGKGRGELLHATLELAERCRKRRSQPLAMAYADVDVDFGGGKMSEKKGNRTERRKGVDGGVDTGKEEEHDPDNDVSSILYGDAVGTGVGGRAPPFRDGRGGGGGARVQARQKVLVGVSPPTTPLEIALYALLAVFCLAFLASCSVFAMRYRRKQEPEGTTTTATTSGDTVAHAHDWVWLGRATLERNSVNTRCSQTLLPAADFNGNHAPEGEETEAVGGASATMGRGEKRPRPTSNVSFPESEVSIRITTNPQEMREDEMAMMDKATSTSPPTVPRERRVRIVAPPHLPPPANGALRMFPAHPPPPIPPHRNLPPNQRHRLRGRVSDAEWEEVSHGMDYDQLIEYFENLKESNA